MVGSCPFPDVGAGQTADPRTPTLKQVTCNVQFFRLAKAVASLFAEFPIGKEDNPS